MAEAMLALAVAVGGAALAADTLQVPGWVQLLLPYLLSGGALGWLYFRVDKKAKELVNERTEAEVADLYEQIAGRAAERMTLMQSQLDAANERVRAAEEKTDRIKADADLEHEKLRQRITQLEQELENTRAEANLIERRKPPSKR